MSGAAVVSSRLATTKSSKGLLVTFPNYLSLL